MKILLDTHTFLWFIEGNTQLSAYARLLIEDIENERMLSIASLWEMSVKASIGKLRLNITFTDLVREHVEGNAIKLLPISPEHLDLIKSMPFYHKDPFDRLLIAQSKSENMALLSKDNMFDLYVGVQRLW